MTIRKSLTTAALALALGGFAAAPTFAQSSAVRSGASTTNTQSQQAGKAVNKAQADLNKLQQDINKITTRVRTQLLAKPEWSQVVAAKHTAETSADAARKAALVTVHNKPEYKALVKERDDAQQVVTAYNTPGSSVPQADFDKASNTLVTDGFAMKKMEMDALKEDDKYKEAATQLEAANAKMKEVDAQVQATLKDDAEYQGVLKQVDAAKTSLANAKTQLAQARQQEEAARQAQAKAREQQQNSGGGGSVGGGSRR